MVVMVFDVEVVSGVIVDVVVVEEETTDAVTVVGDASSLLDLLCKIRNVIIATLNITIK